MSHLPTSMHSNGPPLPPPPPPPATTLQFESPVTDFTPNLTPNITLTCSLNASRASDVTNSPTWSVLTTGSTVIGRRAAATSDDDVIKFLSSLVVMRNGKDHVASITEHTPASALMDLDNLKVKGQINGSDGFLQLSWRYPTSLQTGSYVCEVNGLNSEGRNVVMRREIQVSLATPNISILVDHIGQLKRQNDQRLDENNQQQKAILQLQSANAAQNQRLSDLEHVESGIINCGSAGESNTKTWTGRVSTNRTVHGLDGTDMYLPKSVSFSKSYPR